MKNFIKIVLVAALTAVIPSSSVLAAETEVEAKTEATPEVPTVRENLKIVSKDLTSETIHRASKEIKAVLDTTVETESELLQRIPSLLKVEEELTRLETGTALDKEVGDALKRGIVAKSAGIDEAELRLGTPRHSKHILRHVAAEQELKALLEPSMWQKIKWWWKG